MHAYALRATDEALDLAARCAYAVEHLPEGRQHATWKDVPTCLPGPTWKDVKRCRLCGCLPERPCTIVLKGGCGQAQCVPAGVYYELCSACEGMEEVA
jgi:hypothetical protein